MKKLSINNLTPHMADNTITIKATDYRYPTREERKAIYTFEPDVRNFGFTHENPLVAILSKNKNIDQAYYRDNLFWWDNCLQSRIYSLSQAYLNALVHFQRGIPDKMDDFESQHYINRLQFDFYAETYYYLVAVVRDNIAQLLNVFYQLKIKETNIHFNESFADKLPIIVKTIVSEYIRESLQTMEYRNSFTHRFPPNHPDNRSHIEIVKGQTTYYSASGKRVTSRDFVDNIVFSQTCLADLLNRLRHILKSKT
jgi:hypothetical protein